VAASVARLWPRSQEASTQPISGKVCVAGSRSRRNCLKPTSPAKRPVSPIADDPRRGQGPQVR
jgi:hypothetical protein